MKSDSRFIYFAVGFFFAPGSAIVGVFQPLVLFLLLLLLFKRRRTNFSLQNNGPSRNRWAESAYSLVRKKTGVGGD